MNCNSVFAKIITMILLIECLVIISILIISNNPDHKYHNNSDKGSDFVFRACGIATAGATGND